MILDRFPLLLFLVLALTLGLAPFLPSRTCGRSCGCSHRVPLRARSTSSICSGTHCRAAARAEAAAAARARNRSRRILTPTRHRTAHVQLPSRLPRRQPRRRPQARRARAAARAPRTEGDPVLGDRHARGGRDLFARGRLGRQAQRVRRRHRTDLGARRRASRGGRLPRRGAGGQSDGRLRHYPGSPFIALGALRDRDRLRLFEMHANECEALAHNVREAGRDAQRRAIVYADDGFAGLKALLPPPPRRGWC